MPYSSVAPPKPPENIARRRRMEGARLLPFGSAVDRYLAAPAVAALRSALAALFGGRLQIEPRGLGRTERDGRRRHDGGGALLGRSRRGARHPGFRRADAKTLGHCVRLLAGVDVDFVHVRDFQRRAPRIAAGVPRRRALARQISARNIEAGPARSRRKHVALHAHVAGAGLVRLWRRLVVRERQEVVAEILADLVPAA